MSGLHTGKHPQLRREPDHKPDSGSTPTEFSFAILDGSLIEISTDGLGAPVLLDINSATTPPVSALMPQVPNTAMGAPTITFGPAAATPEPGPLAQLLGGVVAGLLSPPCV